MDRPKDSSLSGAEFAARIRAARGFLGLDLQQMGKKLGLSRQALSRRENEQVQVGPGDRLLMATQLAELTGWPIEFFTDPDLDRLFNHRRQEA